MYRITSILELRNHVEGVWARSEHHAQEVIPVIPIIVGNLICYADMSKEGPEIWTLSPRGPDGYTGNDNYTGNVVWCSINGNRVFFTYDHQSRKIIVKERGTQGAVIGTFDEKSNIDEVNALFNSLNV